MSKLTDEQIRKLQACENLDILNGQYEPYKFARAIEAAATEPLLQRIAHLEATASANYGRGHADAHSMLTDRIAELERQLEEARKDAEPIRRMKQRADELIAAFENAPDGKALDMQKGQS